MIWFIIYMLSVMITGFAIAGVMMGSRSNEVISARGIASLCLITFFPVANTLAAATVIMAVLWLYWFRPTKAKPKPPV